ncbi:MAG: quinolinate synthase NadA, partial [bacterium]|nr:quinolinate synthase NadA [bacterium]
MTADMVRDAKREHPEAVVVVHPECQMEVIELADAVRSTGGMLKFCGETDAEEILVGTERGMLYPLSKTCPDKKFYPVAEEIFCPTMKMGTLTHLRDALKLKRYEITVAEEYVEPARMSIERMLEINRG